MIERLRYKFDIFFAKGTPFLLLLLMMCTVVVVLLISGVLIVFNIRPSDGASVAQIVWLTFMHTYDPSQIAYDEGGWLYKFVMLTACMAGIFILSTLISILTTGFETKLEQLRRGKTAVLERNHVIILGWSAQVFALIEELILANENQKYASIVILADVDKVDMEEQITARITTTKTTRIVCRTGSAFEPNALPLLKFNDAKSIIILPADDNTDPDAYTLKSILAIVNAPNRKNGRFTIVGGFRDMENYEAAKIACKDEAELILIDNVISQIIAQTSRQAGLADVVMELLGFDGDEMYFASIPTLYGQTFGDSLARFEDSCLIGIKQANGGILLNPPHKTMFNEGDSVIAISRDDDTIMVSKNRSPEPHSHAFADVGRYERKPEHILIINSNRKLPVIVHELFNYVPQGTEITLLSAADATAYPLPERTGITIHTVMGKPTKRAVLDAVECNRYNSIIVLSPEQAIDPEAADALVLITLIHIRDILNQTGATVTLTSEILEERNRSLAQIAHVDDFIVSNKLSSMYLTQLSENREIAPLLRDIFDSDGSEIYLKPAERFIKPDIEIDFYTVLAACAAQEQIAIGYKQADGKIVVNPVKSAKRKYSAADKIIVIAEEE